MSYFRQNIAPFPYLSMIASKRLTPLMFGRDGGNGSSAHCQCHSSAAEKVARYKHAQLSAVHLAGDISGKMDDVSLDELLVTIKQEWAKLGPLIDLEAVQVPPG